MIEREEIWQIKINFNCSKLDNNTTSLKYLFLKLVLGINILPLSPTAFSLGSRTLQFINFFQIHYLRRASRKRFQVFWTEITILIWGMRKLSPEITRGTVSTHEAGVRMEQLRPRPHTRPSAHSRPWRRNRQPAGGWSALCEWRLRTGYWDLLSRLGH